MDTGFLIAGFHMIYGAGAPDKRFFPVLTRMTHFRSGSKLIQMGYPEEWSTFLEDKIVFIPLIFPSKIFIPLVFRVTLVIHFSGGFFTPPLEIYTIFLSYLLKFLGKFRTPWKCFKRVLGWINGRPQNLQNWPDVTFLVIVYVGIE